MILDPSEQRRRAGHVPGGLDIASATTQPLDMPYTAQSDQLGAGTDSLPNDLGERYLPQRRLGRGGMATVYLARDTKHDRLVAVKVLNEALTARVGAQRFVQEIRLTARLQHPHVLALLDSGVFGPETGALAGRPYYVMPYVDGESLRSRLDAHDTLSFAELLRVLRDVADALSYAHAQGVVHRDIKPENILLSGEHAVIADFGIAKALFDSQKDVHPDGFTSGDIVTPVTRLSTLVGTPAYMAPEQADTTMRVDQRADIYAWGVVAYELLVGRHPFAESANAREFVAAHVSEMPPPLRRSIVASDVPSSLVRLVMRCLEKDPARRPQEVSELMEVVEDASAKLLARKRWRAVRSSSFVVASIVLVAAALTITGALTWRTRATALDSALGGAGKSQLELVGTRDTAAYAAVDRGLRIWGHSTDLPAFVREQALREFERAYRLDPNYADAFANAAELLLDVARSTASLALYDSAAVLAQRALAVDPGQFKAVNVLSMVELAHDRPAAALPVIERAVREKPSSAELLALLGHTRQLFGDSAAAWDAVMRAVRLAPRSDPILTNAFDVALALHRYDDARKLLAARRALDPGDLGMLRASGWLAAALGDSIGVASSIHEFRARGGVVRAGPMLTLVRRADESLKRELATASPDSYGSASAADSAAVFSEKAKLFMMRHDIARVRPLIDSAYAIVIRLASSPTSTAEWKRQRWREIAWLAAARGDRSVALDALERGATSPRITEQPGSTIDAEQTCVSAEVFGLLGDVEPMLSALRRCLAMPNGGDPSELTEPPFLPYQADPRFRALIVPGTANPTKGR